MGQQVAELGKRVAAHAGDRGAAPGVLVHEVGDDIVAEPVFQIEHVVRDPQSMGNLPGVGDRVEGTAGSVHHLVAVAEQLHGGADHLVPLGDQQRGGHRAVHPTAHCHHNSLLHGMQYELKNGGTKERKNSKKNPFFGSLVLWCFSGLWAMGSGLRRRRTRRRRRTAWWGTGASARAAARQRRMARGGTRSVPRARG